jgi:hypothetical protein
MRMGSGGGVTWRSGASGEVAKWGNSEAKCLTNFRQPLDSSDSFLEIQKGAP